MCLFFTTGSIVRAKSNRRRDGEHDARALNLQTTPTNRLIFRGQDRSQVRSFQVRAVRFSHQRTRHIRRRTRAHGLRCRIHRSSSAAILSPSFTRRPVPEIVVETYSAPVGYLFAGDRFTRHKSVI